MSGQPVADPIFEQLFHGAPCGYLVTTDDGRILDVNDTFLEWTGRTRADLLGTRLQELLPVGDQILYSTHCLPQLPIAGRFDEVAVEILGADRSRHPALLSARRTPTTDGTPAQVRVVAFSARERRRYEKELLTARRRAEAAEADLGRLVLFDQLTGLPNRVGFQQRLTAALEARTAGGGRPGPALRRLGLLFIDLDEFKAVNDSLGHAAGDELLTVVARRLSAAVRSSAVLGRFAGDEFVLIDELDSPADAEALARRLLGALREPVVLGGLELVVSASIGIAFAEATTATELLLRQADVAMYRAKERGRGCWELHSSAHRDPTSDRLHLLGELRTAVEGDQLRLHYQPRIDLPSGRLVGVEALVRWQHPTRGLLPPAAFIDVAEQSGVVRELGAWVLDRAVADVARWQRTGGLTGAPLDVAVNLSTRQLADPGLQARVARALDRHDLDPARLTLEITETSLMGDPDAALKTLQALEDLGVDLAVDDFGTGYSSLTYLRRFPVDELKIDRSFTAGLPDRADDSAIVASCIHLAHALGMRAVAEGVETPEQHAALLELGCDQAQGYHYSRPLAEPDLVAWQAARNAPGRPLPTT